MTDNEIIKALECCNGWDGRCLNCPLNREGTNCKEKLNSYALGLISSQKAEILELQKRIINWRTDMNYRPDEIKSEAIKEFAHFVIDRSGSGVIYTSDIPDLVKEMTKSPNKIKHNSLCETETYKGGE